MVSEWEEGCSWNDQKSTQFEKLLEWTNTEKVEEEIRPVVKKEKKPKDNMVMDLIEEYQDTTTANKIEGENPFFTKSTTSL